MNTYILNAMDLDNLTQERLYDNEDAARYVDYAYNTTKTVYGAACAAAYGAANIECWVTRYFGLTGETRSETHSDYEAELQRDNSFKEAS